MMRVLFKYCVCGIVLFMSVGVFATTYYVDDDGPNDPGPYDPNVSDPLMDGSADHPFDNIQEGIDAAVHGDTVTVLTGTYYENISFNDKNIILTSTSPEDPDVVATTIIDGSQGSRPIVTFSGSETANCQLQGFTITNGTANWGSGIRGNFSLAAINNCTISGNVPVDYGGGLYGCDGSITNCTITGNTANNLGGGLLRCDGSITNCTISGNVSGNRGGGLFECHGSITSCIINGNMAGNHGGGLDVCKGSITNCTITGNTANIWGGGLLGCHGTITNCIIWYNTDGSSGDQLNDSSIPTYSCIQDWTGGGTGNLTVNPLFADTSSPDPTDWNLRLLSGSPCIDAGTNTPPDGLPSTDIEGFPRPFDGDGNGSTVADMGAYESHQDLNDPFLYVTPSSLSFSAFEAGSNPAVQTITIRNIGNHTSNWSADLTGKPDWLTATPVGGMLEYNQSEDVTLSVDITGLSGGQYSYSFEVSDPAAQNSPQSITVDLEVIGPILEISEASFSFRASVDDTNPDPTIFSISNTGGGTLSWLADLNDKPDWLTLTPNNGSLEYNQNDTVVLSVDASGLTDGIYSCEINVADPAAINSPRTITVYLSVGYIIVPGRYLKIQSAIDAVVDGFTIVVSPGTYYENINFKGKNIILASTDPEDPAVVDSTIIDGGNDGSVVTFSGSETADCVLRGFSIRNGNAANDPNYHGGGILGNSTHASIEYCKIIDNDADSFGGGLYDCDGSINHCTVSGNWARNLPYYSPREGGGGGLALCDGIISDCLISDNATRTFFAGDELWWQGYGGGLYRCHGIIANCKIINNRYIGYIGYNGNGGGLSDCDGSITNCTITGNSARVGGGLYYCDGSITNCTITGNSAAGSGGGLNRCDGLITNCTITDNSAYYGGGFHWCNASITNCIIWGNSAEISGDQLYLYPGLTPSYSCIQDWTGGGTGNLSSNPLFADYNDIHLQSEHGRWDPNNSQWVYDDVTSPCIDAGNPSDPNWMNELWPHGGRINMGAYGGTPQASMSAYPVGSIADLDHDNRVTLSDFARFSQDWQTAEYLLDTDFDLNGVVDINDLSELAYYWLWEQGAILIVSDSDFSSAAYEGCANPNPNILTITNSGGGTLSWLADLNEMPDWLTVNPTSGVLEHDESEDVTLSVDVNDLSGGQYSYSFEVSDPAAQNSPQSVTVDLVVIGPILEISEASFSFIASVDDTNPDPTIFLISNTGGGTLSWLADLNEKPDWLTVNPSSGSLSQGQSVPVTVSADITGLTIGQYSYSFEVSDPAAQNSPQTVTVDLGIFDLEQGIVAHWKLDGDATDFSGNSHHGTIHNDPYWTSEGKDGGAMQLDPNDYIEVEGYKGITGKNSRTCAAWIRLAQNSADEMMILYWGDPMTTGSKWDMRVKSSWIDPSSSKLELGVHDGGIRGETKLDDGYWHHVAVVMEDDGSPNLSEIRLYVDGEQEENTTIYNCTTPPDVDTLLDFNVTIGANFYDGSVLLYSTGFLDDVRLYDQALSEQEIAALYALY